MTSSLIIEPIRVAQGRVALPGSKSISNRTLLLSALAVGKTTIHDVLDSDDTTHMLNALQGLGVQVSLLAAHTWEVTGAKGVFASDQAKLFLGNAGTAFRPLTAVLACLQGEYELSGVPRMHERPIGDLVDALRALGAQIEYLGQSGYPPLAIHALRPNLSAEVSIRGNVSSQFLTGLLLALPLLGRPMSVKVLGELISKPYIDITLNSMARFGVDVQREGYSRFFLPSPVRYQSPGAIYVEADASSASYFLAAGAISALREPGSVVVTGVGSDSVQGDVKFAHMLEQMGAQIHWSTQSIEATASQESVSQGSFRAKDFDCSLVPDAAMTLAMVALFARGTTRLLNIGSWRVKETDRIVAMANELRKLGASVEEGSDYLFITPPESGQLNQGCQIKTYDDHRMAMCFSLAALAGVRVEILDPDCVKKTFPEYFKVLGALCSRQF